MNKHFSGKVFAQKSFKEISKEKKEDLDAFKSGVYIVDREVYRKNKNFNTIMFGLILVLYTFAGVWIGFEESKNNLFSACIENARDTVWIEQGSDVVVGDIFDKCGWIVGVQKDDWESYLSKGD